MAGKTVQSRILFKTDTRANWKQKKETFQTLPGELYFYKDWYETGRVNHAGQPVYAPRLKIGTGDKLGDIPFLQNDYLQLPYIDSIFDGYLNWVPLSTEANSCKIYNSVGYKEGYRLSSNGAEKVQETSVTTGYIPMTTKDKFYMSGADWHTAVKDGYTYVIFYDKNFNQLATANHFQQESGGVSNMSAGTILVNNKTAHQIVFQDNMWEFNFAYQEKAEFAYIRISATGLGKDLIITKNETINSSTSNILGTAILGSLVLG